MPEATCYGFGTPFTGLVRAGVTPLGASGSAHGMSAAPEPKGTADGPLAIVEHGQPHRGGEVLERARGASGAGSHVLPGPFGKAGERDAEGLSVFGACGLADLVQPFVRDPLRISRRRRAAAMAWGKFSELYLARALITARSGKTNCGARTTE